MTKYRSLIPEGARKAIGAIEIDALEAKSKKGVTRALKSALANGQVTLNGKTYTPEDVVDDTDVDVDVDKTS